MNGWIDQEMSESFGNPRLDGDLPDPLVEDAAPGGVPHVVPPPSDEGLLANPISRLLLKKKKIKIKRKIQNEKEKENGKGNENGNGKENENGNNGKQKQKENGKENENKKGNGNEKIEMKKLKVPIAWSRNIWCGG